MDNIVTFRDFEERDIDFIYKCKNDAKLNELTVGQYHPFSYKETENWVKGCMGEHNEYKFWAVCKNNESKDIIGWTSISKIDKANKKAFFHGIVIADPKYKIGIPWIEIQLFVMNYAFNILNLHRLEYSCLSDHKVSMAIGPVMFFAQEGLFKEAVFKNNRFYDLAYFGLLKDEYFSHLYKGDYELFNILERYANFRKK